MMSFGKLASAVVLLALCALSHAAEAASVKKTYTMPTIEDGMSTKNEQYLIGVISTFFVVLATYLAVKSMVDINYDDDTLLMVEVPEDNHHEE